ncbi:hypothetical protein HMPREF2738_00887 [Clostridiales bacterium KLE1615]|nr:hypothetical protein HMPREF2738_00887 [Clostridiales bacterium KLE1615]
MKNKIRVLWQETDSTSERKHKRNGYKGNYRKRWLINRGLKML